MKKALCPRAGMKTIKALLVNITLTFKDKWLFYWSGIVFAVFRENRNVMPRGFCRFKNCLCRHCKTITRATGSRYSILELNFSSVVLKAQLSV